MSESDFGFDAIEILTRGKRSKARPIKAVGKRQKDKLAGTAHKSPEVMVKISGGGKSKVQVYNHMTYITRNGNLEATTEDGQKISNHSEIKDLLREWQVDSTKGYGKVRLAFNIVLSMPAGTPPEGVRTAAREFAKDNFWSGHRYLMVLHTDTPHPHVHVVVKAENEEANHRIHVTKAVLEEWRENFAGKLREQGISANATPREIRGQSLKAKTQAIYHLEKRGASTVMANRVAEVAKQLLAAQEAPKVEPWTQAMKERREKILELFGAAAAKLREEGDDRLAVDLEKFASELPRIVTRNEVISEQLKRIIAERRGETGVSDKDLAQAVQEVSHAKQPAVEQGRAGGEKIVSHAKQPDVGKAKERKRDIERE